MPEAAPAAPAPLPSTTVPPQAIGVAAEAPPVEPKAAKPKAPEVDDSLELTVDGQVERLPRAEAIKRLQKAAFADKVTQQAREALKAVKAREEAWKAEMAELETDEEAFLRKKGRDPEALARKILERKLRESEQTPEQREAEAAKAEAASLKKQLAEHTAKQEAAALEQQTVHIQKLMESELHRAATAKGMATDADSFYAIYQAVQESFDAGLPVDAGWADRIIERAQETTEGAFTKLEQAVLKGLKGDALVKRLGPAVVEELRRHRIEQLRGKRAAPVAPPPVEVPKQSGYLSIQEANAQMRRLNGSK